MKRLPVYPAKPHASGQARVKWAGVTHYLGKHGSPESYAKFADLIGCIAASLQAKAVEQPVAKLSKRTITVGQLCDAYMDRNRAYYASNKTERELIFYALQPLVDLYSPTLANEFGPLGLQAVQVAMTTRGRNGKTWSRGFVNSQMGKVRRAFKWGVSQELIKQEVYASLLLVEGLRKGRSAARETERVKPVDPKVIKAVLPFCNRQVQAMIQLQQIHGLRSGEIVQLRGELIDTKAHRGLWEFKLVENKNGWRGQTQTYYLGKQAQALLKPFVKADPTDYWFSPAAARKEQYDANAKAPEEERAKKRKANPKRRPGAAYTTRSYRRHIYRALQKLREKKQSEDRFHPHQIRHTVGTDIRKSHGAEGSRVALGHARLSTTEIYAERDLALARRIARDRG